jgi:2-hydroxychromene-2-carboxylate isomerase
VDSQSLITVVAAAVLILVGIGAYAYQARLRRERLRKRFGPEYERTVAQVGNPTEADAILSKRVERVARFKLRPLSREQADAFNHEWLRIQGLFVDDPDNAVVEADALVARVMEARGYPTRDFDRLADDVSVDHPHVVENYRTARALMARRASGELGTEELRRAVVNYRALFNDLMDVAEPAGHRRAS